MKVEVEVRTGSSKARIEKIEESLFKVYLHSAPDKGKANSELIELISEYFGVSKGEVEILSGLKSRRKVVNISSL